MKLISVLLFFSLCLPSAFSQSLPLTDARKKEVAEYIVNLREATDHWLKHRKADERKSQLLKSLDEFEDLKLAMASEVLTIRSQDDINNLKSVLDHYSKDESRLIQELLVWKYQRPQDNYSDFIFEFEGYVKDLRSITSILSKEENYDDKFSMLLSLDTYEASITLKSEQLVKFLQN